MDITAALDYPPAAAVPELMERLCDWLRDEEAWTGLLASAPRLTGPIVRALLAHQYVVWIQPFSERNGGVARWLQRELLLEAGVPDSLAFNLELGSARALLEGAALLAGDRFAQVCSPHGLSWLAVFRRLHDQYLAAVELAKSQPAAFVQYATQSWFDLLFGAMPHRQPASGPRRPLLRWPALRRPGLEVVPEIMPRHQPVPTPLDRRQAAVPNLRLQRHRR